MKRRDFCKALGLSAVGGLLLPAASWYKNCMTMDPKNPQGYISYANVYRKIIRKMESVHKLHQAGTEIRNM